MPTRVTEADIARALRAVRKLGLTHEILILPDGTIRIRPFSGGQVPQDGAKDAADVVEARLDE
jgi:hypothetical protein